MGVEAGISLDGGGGSDTVIMSTSFFKNNSIERGNASATYLEVGRFAGKGSATHTLSAVYATTINAGGTGGKIRIVDLTNGNAVICEATGQSHTAWTVISLGAITNQAAGDAVFSIEIGGDGANSHDITHIYFEYTVV